MGPRPQQVQHAETQQRPRPSEPRGNQSRPAEARNNQPRPTMGSAPNTTANSDVRRKELTAALARGLAAEFAKQPGKELSGPLAPLFQLGKLVPRLSDCFFDLESVVIRGLVDNELLEPQSEPESDYDSDAELPSDAEDDDEEVARKSADRQAARERTIRRQRERRAYKWLVQTRPRFPKQLAVFLNELAPGDGFDDSIIPKIIDVLQKGLDSARTADTRKIRERILRLVENEKDFVAHISAPQPHDKSLRGFNHPDTGRLLCPVRYISRYNEQYRAEILKGKPAITHNDFPLFMYDKTRKRNDPLQGFCRSYLLIDACKEMLFGSGVKSVTADIEAASNPSRHATKQNIAQKLGMKFVTPATIAYTACQVRFALSAAPQWDVQDGVFSLPQFYYNILEQFDDNEEWGNETVGWWNSQLFSAQGPLTSKRKAADLPIDEESDIAKMKRARKERLRTERENREHQETERRQRQRQREEAAGFHHDQWEDEGPNNSNNQDEDNEEAESGN